jgi:hypothetical protein
VSAGEAMGGNSAIQAAIYIATVLFANTVANNAAAALMYPIAIDVAEQRGIDKHLMAFLLMLASAASFAVPFGDQANLMVRSQANLILLLAFMVSDSSKEQSKAPTNGLHACFSPGPRLWERPLYLTHRVSVLPGWGDQRPACNWQKFG